MIANMKLNKITDIEGENTKLKEQLKQLNVASALIKWQRLAYFIMPIGVVLSLFILLQYFFTDWQFNYPYKLVNIIDSIESDTQKNSLMGVMYSPIAGIAWVLQICWSRLIHNESINKKRIELSKDYDKSAK